MVITQNKGKSINPSLINKQAKLVVGGLALLLLVMGIIICPSYTRIVTGIKNIVTNPSINDFDSFYWSGEVGASIFHAGLCLIIALFVYYITNTTIHATELSAVIMLVGFSFYGKNILNMWFPIIGVLLSSKVTGEKLKNLGALAIFSTSISTIFSVIAFGNMPISNNVLRYFLAGFFTVLGGFLLGILARYTTKLHHGLSLYNAGFAAGLSGGIVNLILKAFGLVPNIVASEEYYITGENLKISILLFIMLGYLVLAGFVLDGNESISQLIRHRSKGEDFIQRFGLGATLINMGLAGMLSVAYIIFVGGQLDSSLFACIFAAAAVAAFGSTLRTHVYPLLGVFTGSFVYGAIVGGMNGENILLAGMSRASSRKMLLSAVFSAGATPVVTNVGRFAGFAVGLLQSIACTFIKPLHGGMVLYNNGYMIGLIIMVLYPLFNWGDRQEKED